MEKTKKLTPIGNRTVFVFYDLKTGKTIFQYISIFKEFQNFKAAFKDFENSRT